MALIRRSLWRTIIFVLFLWSGEGLASGFSMVRLGWAGSGQAFVKEVGLGFMVGFSRRKTPPIISHPAATCTVDRPRLLPGEAARVTAAISDFDMNSVSYTWNATGGKIQGRGSSVEFDSKDLTPGLYHITARVSDQQGNRAICSVHVTVVVVEKPNHSPELSCRVERSALSVGESTNVFALATDADQDPLTFQWSATAGKITADGAHALFDSTGVPPESMVTVAVVASDGHGGNDRCTNTILLTAPPKPKPQPVTCLRAGFPRNSARLSPVDKACLDEVTLKMQNNLRSSLWIKGYSDQSERAAKALAQRRAESAQAYLIEEKKLDSSRVEAKGADPLKGTDFEERKKNRRIEIVFYPEGAR